MKFALDTDGNKIEVQYSGQRAICICCNSNAIGRYGKVRPKHWYHKNIRNCDNWYEPTTEWHLNWQNKFPQQNQEVILKDENNTKHIADIRLNNGVVIEIQNSPIKIDEIYQRETFYGKNGGLIWILNGEKLLTYCSIEYEYEEYFVSIEVPTYIPNMPNYDYLRDELLEQSFIKEIERHKHYREISVINGVYFVFFFDKDIDFNSLISKLDKEILNFTHGIYPEHGEDIWLHFEINYKSSSKDRLYDIRFTKQHWGKFINEMKAPLFIDNLKGLDNGLLYWYNERKIVKKSVFLKKYLSHT